jgi:hypothetical protein
MDPLDPLSLLERARQELQAGKPDRADFALELLQCQMQQRQMQAPAPAAPALTIGPSFNWLPATQASRQSEPKPQSVQPVLALHKSRQPNPLHPAAKQYINMWKLGHPFNFSDAAKWVENANLGIALNLSAGSNKRPHWRKQLSNALDSLCKSRHLDRGEARGHYIVVKHP